MKITIVRVLFVVVAADADALEIAIICTSTTYDGSPIASRLAIILLNSSF